ncbi:MAG: S8 family peptidase [Rhizobiaceae bacterium]
MADDDASFDDGDGRKSRRRAEFVNNLLFETPGGTRFTQGSPILPNIWMAYARNPTEQLDLILNVHYTKHGGPAAAVVRSRLAEYRAKAAKLHPAIERKPARISYIPGQIAAKLYFDELIRVVLPLTTWWQEIRRKAWDTLREYERRANKPAGAADWERFPIPSEGLKRQFHHALLLMRRELLPPRTYVGSDDTPESNIAFSGDRRAVVDAIPNDLVWLVRVVGLIANCFRKRVPLLSEDDELSRPVETDFVIRRATGIESSATREARIRTAATNNAAEANRRAIVESFFSLFEDYDEQELRSEAAHIFRANKNRPVHLAVSESALTVKADAARLLFNVSCASITWAVIDSGIDRNHPAFRNTSQKHALEVRQRLAGRADSDGYTDQVHLEDLESRVDKTIDFTRLRELLDVGANISADGEISNENEEERDELLTRIAVNIAAREGVALDRSRGISIIPPEFLGKARQRMREFRQHIRQGRNIEWADMEDMIVDREPAEPDNDHGTHVAGILGADWIEDIESERGIPMESRTRRMRGVCPDIRLIDVRVFRQDGLTDEFELMAAIQYLRWMNSRAGFMQVHGANMSLSLVHEVRRFACGQTPICIECDEATASGMVIVAAAGNRGFDFEDLDEIRPNDGYRTVSVTDPGNAASVITVGATHRRHPHEFGVSYFSSRGPTGDGRLKPDVVAPGEKIEGPTTRGQAGVKDGTSMAAPHVSGVAAMLMARHTELIGDPAKLKQIICRTATDLGRERYFQGHGLVDALRAMQSV